MPRNRRGDAHVQGLAVAGRVSREALDCAAARLADRQRLEVRRSRRHHLALQPLHQIQRRHAAPSHQIWQISHRPGSAYPEEPLSIIITRCFFPKEARCVCRQGAGKGCQIPTPSWTPQIQKSTLALFRVVHHCCESIGRSCRCDDPVLLEDVSCRQAVPGNAYSCLSNATSTNTQKHPRDCHRQSRTGWASCVRKSCKGVQALLVIPKTVGHTGNQMHIQPLPRLHRNPCIAA